MKKYFLSIIALGSAAAYSFAQCSPCLLPFVSSSQATGNSSSVTIPKPVGVAQNDVMVAAVHVGWCNSGSAITPPVGWTLINSTSNTGPGCGVSNTTIQLATFYKVVTSVEPNSYTFTGNTNQFYVGGIVAYSGVNTTSPINVSSNNGLQELCANIVANSVTTTVTCTRLVAVFFCSVNSSANNIVPQNSLTERVDVGTTGNHPWGNENLEMSDELKSTIGSTGNKTAALTGCSGNSWVTGGQLIALACQSTTGMNENLQADHFSVSPNPSQGMFQLTLKEKPISTEHAGVFNVIGEAVKIFGIKMQSTMLDLTELPKGIYFLKVSSTEGMLTKKIVIE